MSPYYVTYLSSPSPFPPVDIVYGRPLNFLTTFALSFLLCIHLRNVFALNSSSHSHSRSRKKKAKKSKKVRRSSSLSSIESVPSEAEVVVASKKDKKGKKKKYSDISDNTSDFGSESGNRY